MVDAGHCRLGRFEQHRFAEDRSSAGVGLQPPTVQPLGSSDSELSPRSFRVEPSCRPNERAALIAGLLLRVRGPLRFFCTPNRDPARSREPRPRRRYDCRRPNFERFFYAKTTVFLTLPPMSDLYDTLDNAISNAAGLAINANLSALDGSQHVLPPTYADAPHKHNMTEPDANGVSAWVSIDSAASFANRVEEQLVRRDANLGSVRSMSKATNGPIGPCRRPIGPWSPPESLASISSRLPLGALTSIVTSSPERLTTCVLHTPRPLLGSATGLCRAGQTEPIHLADAASGL